jgi:NADH:ubiquinone oxidoreductase subunit 5 (subunit L)/multisubunit Na+/H+ antiporter MnhA subunit
MGGLRKVMPITFGLSIIMILTTSGLPPFAAFFSKGLIITSVTETGNLWQVLLIYATTALTFAYSLRFITLTFLGKESEHLEKLHVHEAPKIMLLPAAILAVLCVAWGFVEPWLGSFMRVEGETNLLGAFFNIETPTFFAILVPAGLIIYLTYYKNSEVMGKIRSNSNPLTDVLKHGYFFDDLYERIAGKGIVDFSNGVRRANETVMNGVNAPAKGIVNFANSVRRAEVAFSGRLPQLVANSIISMANAVHKYLDVLADELLIIIAHRTLRSASKMKSVPQTSLQHYIAAALLGFILILILIILTIGV